MQLKANSQVIHCVFTLWLWGEFHSEEIAIVSVPSHGKASILETIQQMQGMQRHYLSLPNFLFIDSGYQLLYLFSTKAPEIFMHAVLDWALISWWPTKLLNFFICYIDALSFPKNSDMQLKRIEGAMSYLNTFFKSTLIIHGGKLAT